MKLKLITTETLGTVPCDFYRNMNDDMLLTREQIGQALEYKDPSKTIRKIHLKHKDRLEPLCIRLKLDNNQNGANLSKSEEQERVYYTQRGIMELCRWSRQPKADKFMDWAWDIIESYRNNTLSSQNIDMKAFTDILTSLSNTQAAMTHTLNLLNEKINNIEEQPKPKRKYSYWTSKMFPKYEELMDYLGYESNGELYKYLYKEFNDMYPDYDLRQVADDYCYENKLETWDVCRVLQHIDGFHSLLDCSIDDGIAKVDIYGKDYLLIHGDYDTPTKQGYMNLASMCGFFPENIFCGHKHFCMYSQESKFVQSGSLAGSGCDYTIEKRLNGKPSQMVCVVDETGLLNISPVML